MWMDGVLFGLLLLGSAFFSSAETALLSLSRMRLSFLVRQGNPRARVVRQILEKPDSFFSTVLIGNNLVNIAAATLSTVLVAHWIKDPDLVVVVSTLGTTLLVLVFSEMLPKSYAFRNSERLSLAYAYPLRWLKWLLHPLGWFFSRLVALLFPPNDSAGTRDRGADSGRNHRNRADGLDELRHFLESEVALFRYHPHSLRMIQEILGLLEKDARSIMTPRPRLVALPVDATLEDLREVMTSRKHSRIPLFEEGLDHIVGVIEARRLARALLSRQWEGLNLKALAVEPLFVSEFSPLNYVLREMKRRKTEMAIVLDEYGATSGLLTLSDVLGEVLGEWTVAHGEIRRIGGQTYRIRGDVAVDEVARHLQVPLPTRSDYTTMSGLFIYHYGRFPKTGTRLELAGGVRLTVLKMGERSIHALRLEWSGAQGGMG